MSMARDYPRYLFSNPKNTKSEGPFIIHTLSPRFIARVITNGGSSRKFDVVLLKCWEECSFEELRKQEDQMREWLISQVKSGLTF